MTPFWIDIIVGVTAGIIGGVALYWYVFRKPANKVLPGTRDQPWEPTGQISFQGTQLFSAEDKPGPFYMIVEEQRAIIHELSGTKAREIRWRPATPKEVKRVTRLYNSTPEAERGDQPKRNTASAA